MMKHSEMMALAALICMAHLAPRWILIVMFITTVFLMYILAWTGV